MVLQSVERANSIYVGLRRERAVRDVDWRSYRRRRVFVLHQKVLLSEIELSLVSASLHESDVPVTPVLKNPSAVLVKTPRVARQFSPPRHRPLVGVLFDRKEPVVVPRDLRRVSLLIMVVHGSGARDAERRAIQIPGFHVRLNVRAPSHRVRNLVPKLGMVPLVRLGGEVLLVIKPAVLQEYFVSDVGRPPHARPSRRVIRSKRLSRVGDRHAGAIGVPSDDVLYRRERRVRRVRRMRCGRLLRWCQRVRWQVRNPGRRRRRRWGRRRRSERRRRRRRRRYGQRIEIQMTRRSGSVCREEFLVGDVRERCVRANKLVRYDFNLVAVRVQNHRVEARLRIAPGTGGPYLITSGQVPVHVIRVRDCRVLVIIPMRRIKPIRLVWSVRPVDGCVTLSDSVASGQETVSVVSPYLEFHFRVIVRRVQKSEHVTVLDRK